MIFKHKFSFVFNFLIIFIVTFSFLYAFDLVPAEFNVMIGRYPDADSAIVKFSGELPYAIKIPKVGVDTYVYNPATTSVKVLDDLLLKGAVRYPGSALLGGEGNIFVFGHSTGYKIVQNKAYKAFNYIKNLKIGDDIEVYSEKYKYVYKVISVELETADKTLINFNTKGKLITLSTCNSFGVKSDRYVVQGEFFSKELIPVQVK